MNPSDDFFVVGTDTGVGKSLVSLLLMQVLFAKGYHPFYLKPFQTGCLTPLDAASDARFIYDHTDRLNGQDPARSVCYCHPNPKAPLFSARDASEVIEPDKVFRQVAEHKKQHAPLVIEGAGGLLVPVAPNLMVVDILAQMDCRALLVARAGLGTINHTLLSIEAMRRRQITPFGIILVETDRTPTDSKLVSENITAIEMFAQVAVAGVIPYIDNFSAPPADAVAVIETLLLQSVT